MRITVAAASIVFLIAPAVHSDECRDALELAARNYLHVQQNLNVHDRIVHDFCEAAERYHSNNASADLTAIGQSFYGQFQQNSADYERIYHSLCTHDDALHEESDYLLLTASVVENHTVAAWSKCMEARRGFETTVANVSDHAFTLKVRWLATCGIATQKLSAFNATNAVCDPSPKGLAIAEAWQPIVCTRTIPSAPVTVVFRGTPTWSGYAFVPPSPGKLPPAPKKLPAIANCIRYQGENCVACSFDPTFANAAANQRWRFTCSRMPPNGIARITFKGTPTIAEGTPDNKIWNGGIWITLTTDDAPDCIQPDPRCFGQHRYSPTWTNFNITNDVRISSTGNENVTLSLLWCQTGPANVNCSLLSPASLSVELVRQ